jgi:hypothetical protein
MCWSRSLTWFWMWSMIRLSMCICYHDLQCLDAGKAYQDTQINLNKFTNVAHAWTPSPCSKCINMYSPVTKILSWKFLKFLHCINKHFYHHQQSFFLHNMNKQTSRGCSKSWTSIRPSTIVLFYIQAFSTAMKGGTFHIWDDELRVLRISQYFIQLSRLFLQHQIK